MSLIQDPLTNIVYAGLKDPIRLLLDNQYYFAALALIFSGIDAMAYLGIPDSKEKVDSGDFIAWCDRYIDLGQTINRLVLSGGARGVAFSIHTAALHVRAEPGNHARFTMTMLVTHRSDPTPLYPPTWSWSPSRICPQRSSQASIATSFFSSLTNRKPRLRRGAHRTCSWSDLSVGFPPMPNASLKRTAARGMPLGNRSTTTDSMNSATSKRPAASVQRVECSRRLARGRSRRLR